MILILLGIGIALIAMWYHNGILTNVCTYQLKPTSLGP